MKANKFLVGALGLAALTLVGCQGKENENGGGGEVVVAETRPEVQATEGAFTLVVQFEETPCNDVVIAGSYKNAQGVESSWGYDEGVVKFELVEGKKTWYQAVIYPIDGYAAGKPIQLQNDGTFSWNGQLEHDGLEAIDGDAIYYSENGGEIQWRLYTTPQTGAALDDKGTTADVPAASAVIYAKCGKWNINPCKEPVPAGNGTFTANLEEALPAGATLIMTGSFDEKSWGDSDREMTKVSDLEYSWTGAYPADFQWKVFYKLEGYADNWANEGNVVFDGSTYSATFTFGEPKLPDEPQPAAAMYIKHPWGTGADADWAWQEMVAGENLTYTYEGAWGGVGANINTTADDAGAQWYEAAVIAGAEGLAVGDAIVFTFVSNDGTSAGTLSVAKK